MLESEDFFQKRPEREQQIYKRISLIGSGSFGKAYLVKHIKDDTLYVIKQLNMVDMSPEQQQTALRQAKILQVLNHPNIVMFKEVYRTSKGKLNIVMEYADAGDLSTRIRKAKEEARYFQETQILNWFTQICLAVKHIHDRKIIHRDLKGQNIFLTSDNYVKIGDFGVATVLQRTLSKAKTVVGSPYYLSPEIISNQPYSFKTDIWSLGAILFELCSLTPPFTANNLQFLALKIIKGSYSHIPQRYSQDLKNLIRSMLNVNAAMRPTINEILCSKVLSNRIKKFLTQSQKLHQFSHTVFHNRNVFNKENDRSGNGESCNGSDLRPPPNLMKNDDTDNIQIQNSSHIAKPHQNQDDMSWISPPSCNSFHKAPKSTQVVKKGANNFFNRPNSNRQIINPKNDLTDLIQIKPTAVQYQEKIEKVKLPHMPPPVIVSRKKMEIPKPVPKRVSVQKVNKTSSQIPPPNNINSQAIKKRSSVIQSKPKLQQPQDPVPKLPISNQKKELIANTPKLNSTPSYTEKPMKRKQSTSSLNKKPTNNTANLRAHKNELVKQKNIGRGSVISKKDKSIDNKKLQLVSEEAKKKSLGENPKSANSKRITKQKPIKPKKQSKRQVTEEEKVNIESNIQQYEREPFQQYEMAYERSSEESIELDLSASQDVPIIGQFQKKDTFLQILSQMQNIQRYVEEAQGAAANLPIIGEELPEILILSNHIREDDTSFDTTNHLNLKRIDQIACELHAQQSIMKTTQNLNLTCFEDHNELENLRMNLEEIFGLDNILFAYKVIQSTIQQKNLDFDQEQIIRSILISNQKIDECLLRKYFRLIVTVIALQHELIINQKQ